MTNCEIRKITYPIIIIILVLFFAVPMIYGLLRVLGLFLLIPGFVITFILAVKRGGFTPH